MFVAAFTLVLAAAPRLSAPALARLERGATSDVIASDSASSMFARSVAQPTGVDQERRLSPGAIIGLICAIAASSVALGIAFGLRRRIDRIAGPDPDKADDD